MKLFINNSNILEIDGVKTIDGTPINGGSVSLKIKDHDGTVLLDSSMSYIADSVGKYQADIPGNLSLSYQQYIVEIEVVYGSERGFWRDTVMAVHRDFSE